MASNKRTIYLGLDYSQFSGGITEINRKMGLLDAEFKLASQQAKNYGNETDQTGVKVDYLAQKIALQNQKVEEAKRAYDDAIASETASQKEIDALNKRLITETASLESLNGQLKQTQGDTDKVSTSTKNLGDIMGKVKEVVAELYGKMKDLTTSFAQTGDELLTLSAQTNMTTTEIQQLQYAANFLDVSFETISGSITRLERNMDNARKGTGDSADAFKKLGIRVTDSRGQLRDANTVFDEAIDKLGKVSNETERDALAMEIFGRSAKELNPLIKAGSAELERYKQEAIDTGVVMSEDTVVAAGRLNDAMDKLHTVFRAANNALAAAFAPILEKVVDLLTEMDPVCLAIVGVIFSMATAFSSVAKSMAIMSIATVTQTGAQTALNTVSIKTVAIVLAIAAAIALVVALIGLIIGKSDDVEKTINKTTKAAKETTSSITNSIGAYSGRVNAAGRNASGTDFWQGGKTWVGEEGPELVELPRGSRITPGSEATGTVINNYYMTIDAKNVKDFNDVVALAQQQKMALRRL